MLNHGFKVCRVCLSPSTIIHLMSLSEFELENAGLFKIFTGIDISGEEGIHDALICQKCTDDIIAAHRLRQRIKKNEMYYFEEQRKQFEDKLKDKDRAQTIKLKFGGYKKTGSSFEEGLRFRTFARASAINTLMSRINSQGQYYHSLPQSDRKPPVCPICHKCFTRKDSLQIHIRTVHFKVKRHKCTFCSQSFYYRNRAEKHMEKQHGQRQVKPTSRTSPVNHVVQPTNDHSLPYPCGIKGCSKRFISRNQLKRHLNNVHTDRSFACVCNKTYKTKSSLKRHQKICLASRFQE